MKRYINAATIYAVLAMICGIFYREFTKWMNFSGSTQLSVLHTHYFILGMTFFLLILLLEKSFLFTDKNTKKILILYHIGLNITTISFLIRGILEVMGREISAALNASISGIAGIGHLLLGVSIVLILMQLRKKC